MNFSILQNEHVQDKINIAESKGSNQAQLKPLYVEKNIYEADIDSPIYRIFESQYLIIDIEKETLTHLAPKCWGDPLENILSKIAYLDKVTNTKNKLLENIANNYYGLSWTVDQKEKLLNWEGFSHGMPSVRVKTTPRKLMKRIMNIRDEFYMLHHFMCRVRYEAEQDIIEWACNTPWEDHLDSLGERMALSFMRLKSGWSKEKEVRLLYYYDEKTPWVNNNVVIDDILCAVPFSWHGIIDEIILGTTMNDDSERELKRCLANQGIICNVKNSKFPRI